MGPQKGLLVLIEFVRGPVVVALHGGFFAGAVHALDPAVGPGVRQLGEAVRHAVFSASAGRAVPTRQKLLGLRGELHAVAGQDDVHPIRQFAKHPAREFGGHHALGPGVESGKSRFAGAVDGHEETLLTFLGLHFREIDAQVPNKMVPEFLLRRTLPGFVRQGQAAAAVGAERSGAVPTAASAE